MCFKRTGSGWLELVRTVPQARAQRPPATSSTTPKPVIKEPGSIPKTRMLSSGILILSFRVPSPEGRGGYGSPDCALRRQSGHNLIGDVKIGMRFAHVVLVIQGFHQAQDLLGLLALYWHRVLRHHRYFSYVESQSLLFEGTAHVLERLRSGDNFVHVRLSFDIISPSFEDEFE